MRHVLPLLALLLPGAAAAQACELALIRDMKTLDLREASSLATLELLRRSSNSSDSWGAEITVPIKGIPVGGGAKAAQSATNEYFSKSSLNWTTDRLVSVATQTLSRNAVESYQACLTAPPSFGPRIAVHDATRTAATVTIRWISPPGAPTRQRLDVGTAGGAFTATFPDSLSTGFEIARIITRDSHSDLRLTVNIGGQQANKFVAYIPPDVVVAPKVKARVAIPATAFVRPLGVALGGPNNMYGTDVLLNAPPYGHRANAAEFEFTPTAAGTYLLRVEYAAASPRPVQILVNGQVAISNALNAPTGCWTPNCQRLLNQGQVTLRDGLNVLRIESSGVFPHLRRIVLEPVP